MAFKSLSQPRIRLAEQVYSQIIQAIHDGAITGEDRIVQEKLAEEFGISRTPVREALFRMEQEGILAVAGHGGFRIRKIGKEEIADIYDTRCSIESFAARLLAEHNDRDRNERLRHIVADAEDLKNASVKAYFNANLTVHRAIVDATNDRFLLEFFDNVWNRGTSFTLFATIESTDLSKSLGDHMSLIDAVDTGDGAKAAERMISHIRDGHRLQTEAGSLSGRVS